MQWETQNTIRTIQKCIQDLLADGYKPSRQAIADRTGLSLSYIHKLVQKNSDYLGQPGDGSVSIVTEVSVPVLNPYRAKPKQSSGDIDISMPRLSGQDYSQILTRIAEALENSSGIGKVQSAKQAQRQTGNDLLSDEQRKKVLGPVIWDKVDEAREHLVEQYGIVGLYILMSNCERYLRKNKAELVKAIDNPKPIAKPQSQYSIGDIVKENGKWYRITEFINGKPAIKRLSPDEVIEHE